MIDSLSHDQLMLLSKLDLIAILESYGTVIDDRTRSQLMTLTKESLIELIDEAKNGMDD